MIVDLWVNALSKEAATRFFGQPGFGDVEGLLGGDASEGLSTDGLLAEMDRLGVDLAFLTSGLAGVDDDTLAFAAAHRDHLRLALTVDKPQRPTRQSVTIRERRPDLVRVTPLVAGHPLNAALYYPTYATCEELGIPVSINVGVPGPRVRSASQDPHLLEDVLIDFPTLVLIGAHMGHPYEELLMTYMRKWPNLYLSTSAYSARYLHPGLLEFMASRQGRGRILFASDHPFFPMSRALADAEALPIPDDAKAEFLGAGAARLFGD